MSPKPTPDPIGMPLGILCSILDVFDQNTLSIIHSHSFPSQAYRRRTYWRNRRRSYWS